VQLSEHFFAIRLVMAQSSIADILSIPATVLLIELLQLFLSGFHNILQYNVTRALAEANHLKMKKSLSEPKKSA
jgi:hypothetical protein